MKHIIFILLALVASALCANAGEAVFIVNSGSSVQTLSASEVEDILLGKKQQWSGGGSIQLAILKDGPAHEAVVKTYAKKSPAQFKTYWRNQVFSGRGIMPTELDKAEAMIRFVAETPNALGYVDSDALSGSVKAITVN